jgi:hypothetical protein
MSLLNRSKSLELRRTIEGPKDSLGRPTSLSLELSVVVTPELYTDSWMSAEIGAAPSYQWLITVSAIGELEIKELSTSAGKPGD